MSEQTSEQPAAELPAYAPPIHYVVVDAAGVIQSSGHVGGEHASFVAQLGGTPITPQQRDLINSSPQHKWQLADGVLSVVTPLSTYQEQGYRNVSMTADRARAAFISHSSTQQTVYQQKAAQAAAFLLEYPVASLASAAPPASWPYLAAEVGITGATMFDVAIAITAASKRWIAAAAQIEALRLTAKKAVANATSESEIQQALAIPWPTP